MTATEGTCLLHAPSPTVFIPQRLNLEGQVHTVSSINAALQVLLANVLSHRNVTNPLNIFHVGVHTCLKARLQTCNYYLRQYTLDVTVLQINQLIQNAL